jgi:CheY-like chemotaxis protein
VEWYVVILVLGVLVLAYATYFTHAVLTRRGGSLEAGVGGEGVFVRVTANERNLSAKDARLASQNRVPAADAEAEARKVSTILGDTRAVRVSRCLWVDDDAAGNVYERRMLERLGIEIDLARSTTEALQLLIGRRYDLIITDLARPDGDGILDAEAGIHMLELMSGAPRVPPVIVYAGRADDRFGAALRAGAIAATTLPSALLEAVLDVLAAEPAP